MSFVLKLRIFSSSRNEGYYLFGIKQKLIFFL